MCEIKLENITHGFNNRKLLINCSYNFEEGKTYVIKGESGIGKTTILNLICGYIKPQEGRVIILKNKIIEYMFQEDMLFQNLSILQNIELKAGALKEKNIEVEHCKISEYLKRVGLEQLRHEKISLLSGGERQRVQIVNSLLSNPDIILLDEPTSRLDEKNKKKIMELIEECFKDKTLIIVSHDNIEKYMKCEVLAIKEGKLKYDKEQEFI